MNMKQCPDCQVEKPVTEFGLNKSRPDGLQHYCRPCYAARSKSSYEARRRAAGKRVRADVVVPEGMKYCNDCENVQPVDDFRENRHLKTGRSPYCRTCHAKRDAAHHLRKHYGLTPEEFEALVAAQRGSCAICETRPAVHVDHDHLTGSVRGVLCFPCNVALGHLKDDPLLFRKASAYLERTTWQKTLVCTGVYRLTSPPLAAAASATS